MQGHTTNKIILLQYGMQQSQQTYPQMYQGQGMVPPQFQYEMSASPPNHLAPAGLEDHNYQNFAQVIIVRIA